MKIAQKYFIGYQEDKNLKVILSIILIIILVALPFLLPVRRVTLYAEDATFFFDTVNRINMGYRMYIDYHHIFGPFSFILLWLGFLKHGISMEAFTVAQAIATLIICTISIIVTFKRLNYFFTILIAILCWVLINAPSPIGYDLYNHFTPAFWYNNLGFIFAGLLLIQISSRFMQVRSIYEPIIEGLLLALLFTNKFQFLVFLSIPYIITFIKDIRQPLAIRYFIIVVVTFMIFVNLQLLIVHSNLFAYINQIHNLVSENTVSIPKRFFFRYIKVSNFYVLLILALTILMHINQREKVFTQKTLFIFSAFLSMLFIKLSCNYYILIPHIPFLEILPLLYITRNKEEFSFTNNKTGLGILFFIALTMFTYVKDIVLNYRYMARDEISLRMDFPPRKTINRSTDDFYDKASAPEFLNQIEDPGYSKFVMDGLSLLQKVDFNNQTLFVCNINDPITMHSDFNYPVPTRTWVPVSIALDKYYMNDALLNQADLILIYNEGKNADVIADYLTKIEPSTIFMSYENENWVLIEKK